MVDCQGTKIFQFCTCPAGRATYNFHLSCKRMHSPLKMYAKKKMGGGGGGVIWCFFKFFLSLLKWYLPTAVSFISASHTLTKRVLHSIFMMSQVLRLSFLKIAFTFRFFCRNFRMSDILAEPPFDWFLNLLHPSTFSYQEEKSIITAIQSVTIQTYFIDENELRKNKYLLRYSLPHYPPLYCTALFAICNHNIRFLLSELKRYLARWKRFLPFRKC